MIPSWRCLPPCPPPLPRWQQWACHLLEDCFHLHQNYNLMSFSAVVLWESTMWKVSKCELYSFIILNFNLKDRRAKSRHIRRDFDAIAKLEEISNEEGQMTRYYFTRFLLFSGPLHSRNVKSLGLLYLQQYLKNTSPFLLVDNRRSARRPYATSHNYTSRVRRWKRTTQRWLVFKKISYNNLHYDHF